MAGSITHTIGQSYKSGAGSTSAVSKTVTSNTETNVETVVTAGATNATITLVLDVSAIQSLMLYSDQPCTIKTNSDSTPADTITLAAKQMIIWTASNIEACPLTVDVTSLHVAVPGATDAAIKVFALLDLD